MFIGISYAIPEEEGWDFAVLPFNTWFTPPLMPKIRYVGVIRESIAIEEFASRNDIVEVVEPLMPAPDLNLWTTHSCQPKSREIHTNPFSCL